MTDLTSSMNEVGLAILISVFLPMIVTAIIVVIQLIIVYMEEYHG